MHEPRPTFEPAVESLQEIRSNIDRAIGEAERAATSWTDVLLFFREGAEQGADADIVVDDRTYPRAVGEATILSRIDQAQSAMEELHGLLAQLSALEAS